MTDDRKLEFDVEVQGTPEEVWRAIATGPGIGSWYVPHEVEETNGGAAVARFGPGPEMEVPVRVAAWEPPHRVVFDGGEDVEGLAFEWLIEAKDGGTCIVRLVNSGFGTGEDWDNQYDGMAQGWLMFLRNLQLHLEHFRGQTATAALPMSMRPGSASTAWSQMTSALGIDESPSDGDRLALDGGGDLGLSGTVVETTPTRITMLVEQPVPGTAFVTAEAFGDAVSLSIWSYLYGAAGAEAAARDEPRWQAWLDGLEPT